MPKDKRGGKLSKKTNARTSGVDRDMPKGSYTKMSRNKIIQLIKANGIEILNAPNGKQYLRYNNVPKDLINDIEREYGVSIKSDELITDTEWTGDIIKHLARGDISLIHANDNVAFGRRYKDSEHPNTVVFFKYYGFDLVKTVIRIKKLSDGSALLLTHTLKVKPNDEKHSRYIEFKRK